jgi:hypothetical protein
MESDESMVSKKGKQDKYIFSVMCGILKKVQSESRIVIPKD